MTSLELLRWHFDNQRCANEFPMAKGLGRGRIGKTVQVKGGRSAPSAGPAWKPYRKGCRQDFNYIALSGTERVYQSMWFDGNQLTDFVLIQQTKVRSRWTDIAKVDCCHQEVHVHRHRKDGSEQRKVLQAVLTPPDMIIGLKMGQDLIFDHWMNNLRRWSRGR